MPKQFKTVDAQYLDLAKRIEHCIIGTDPEAGRERCNELLKKGLTPKQYCHAMRAIWDLMLKEHGARTVYKHPIMDPLEFLGPAGLDKHDVIWPKLIPEYAELCSGKYVEALMTGGIGTAKTTLSTYALAYETHKIMCLRDPHGEFGLDPASEIVMVFQSVTAGTARSVDYNFFRAIIDSSPWFQERTEYDHDLKSELRFANKLTVKAVNSLETAAIGQNVIGGLIDEINFFQLVQQSKRAMAGETLYDQAQQNYNAIVRRRESRFMERGELPGLLCLVSSTRYPGQFTDRKEKQARDEIAKTGKTRIFVYNKRVWEVRPDETFTGKFFRVFIGSRNRNPFILQPHEEDDWPDDDPRVVRVPEEYRHSFDDDIYAALRDIAGVSTLSEHVFFSNMETLDAAFPPDVPTVFSVPKCDFAKAPLKLMHKRLIDPTKPRYAHVDLGATSDSAGICIAHVADFIKVQRTDGTEETLPMILVDGILEVPPPPGGEINFEKIRAIFYRLRELGVNLRWISYDSWQSRDSLQILKNHGFTVGVLSVDKTTLPYDLLKRTVNDGRVRAHPHEKVETELRTLLWDRQRDKIDHPPKGSKDCADALTGCVYGLTMRRELWVNAGVMPKSIAALAGAEQSEGAEI